MLVSIPELLTEPVTGGNESATPWLRVHVEWFTIAFECGIKKIATSIEMSGNASTASEPVLLRVSEAEADSCRVEIFCAAARLCRAGAGY